MENIALVTIKFPRNQPLPDSGSGEECEVPASAAPQNNTPTHCRPSKSTPGMSKPENTNIQPSIGVKFISAGLAACYADMMTFPLDTAKVRLQVSLYTGPLDDVCEVLDMITTSANTMATLLGTDEEITDEDAWAWCAAARYIIEWGQIQGEGSAVMAASRSAASIVAGAATTTGLQYRGMLGTMTTISREEGVRALYNGLVPGLQRQMAFASIRIGLYDSVKNFYLDIFKTEGTVRSNNVGLRILAGITTGAMAVGCAQPTDVVKVRMQAATKGSKRYSGCINAYRTIAVQEGVRGLWKGMMPNIVRNAIVNAAELVAYDMVKESLVKHSLMTDNMPCHFVSAFGAGFCATVFASPVDVVKTRFMNSGDGKYKGATDCAIKMYQQNGAKAFYKGFMPSFMRLGSWNIVMFVSFEQLKRLFVGFQVKSDNIATNPSLKDVSLQQKKFM